MAQGIKETLELLEGIKVLVQTGADVFADGKITLTDLPKLANIAKNFTTLKDAMVGINLVDDEIKDLDAAETQQIIAKVFEIVAAVKGTT